MSAAAAPVPAPAPAPVPAPPSHYGEQQRAWWVQVLQELLAAPPADIQAEIRRQHSRTADADAAYRRCRSAADDKSLLQTLRYEYVRLRVLFDLSYAAATPPVAPPAVVPPAEAPPAEAPPAEAPPAEAPPAEAPPTAPGPN